MSARLPYLTGGEPILGKTTWLKLASQALAFALHRGV
jgi:hypothetical protein